MNDIDREAEAKLRRIVETLEMVRNDLAVVRRAISERREAHAVIGCCLLDRFDPLIAELRSLL